MTRIASSSDLDADGITAIETHARRYSGAGHVDASGAQAADTALRRVTSETIYVTTIFATSAIKPI